MKHFFISIILFCAVKVVTAQELKTKLETSYNAFAQAIKDKNGDKLKASLSSYAYMNIKNQMLSAGVKFPDDFFGPDSEKALSDLAKLTYIKDVANGPTAYAIYSGKDKYKETTLFIFKFLQENGAWKFNLAQEYGSDEITKKIAAKNYAFLSEPKYQPDGVMPETPKEIVPGDYKAMLDIRASGYEIEVFVNGVSQKKINEGSYSGMIMGGIKKGKNIIEIKVTGKKGDSMFPVSVGIRALIDDKEEDVFSYKEESPSSVTQEFVVK